jgi:hypothetical protein
MEALSADWNEFLRLLTRHRVRFVLVGGHAVAIHARPRHTEDLDVFVEATKANARRLRAALVDFGFGEVLPSLEVLGQPGKVFMLGRVPYRLDILTSIDGVSFKEAWRTRAIVSTRAGRIPVIGRDALIANKLASGRPKDVADIVALTGTLPKRGRASAKRGSKSAAKRRSKATKAKAG